MSDVLHANIGIAPDAWEYDLVCSIKTRFGVSAETFLYTLNDLKLIDPVRSAAIKNQIFAHYQATGYQEPGERYRRLNPNAAFLDLLHIARQRAATDPEMAREIEQIKGLIKQFCQQSANSTACAVHKAVRNNTLCKQQE